MSFRFRIVGALFLAAAIVAGCKDPLRIKASFPVVQDTLVAYALNGTPAEYPSALNAANHIVLRAEGSLDYDVAFDIRGADSAVLVPLRLIAGSGTVATARRVGLQKSATAYEALTRAPNSGYTYDSLTVVHEGETFVLESQSPVYCLGSVNPVIYAKLFIQDVDIATRSMRFSITVDPNCGFHSFLPGVPAS